MIQFIKGALREFRHVVWPTRKETQKFFSLVLAILIAFWIYLFIASNIFSEIIFGLKDVLGTGTQVTGQSGLTDEEIDALFSNEVQIETNLTGSTIETDVSWDENTIIQEETIEDSSSENSETDSLAE